MPWRLGAVSGVGARFGAVIDSWFVPMCVYAIGSQRPRHGRCAVVALCDEGERIR